MGAFVSFCHTVGTALTGLGVSIMAPGIALLVIGFAVATVHDKLL